MGYNSIGPLIALGTLTLIACQWSLAEGGHMMSLVRPPAPAGLAQCEGVSGSGLTSRRFDEFPYLVGIMRGFRRICNGAIISPNQVITSGDCLWTESVGCETQLERIRVLPPGQRLRDTEVFGIEKLFVPKEYQNDELSQTNVAKIVLNKTLEFVLHKAPEGKIANRICRPTKPSVYQTGSRVSLVTSLGNRPIDIDYEIIDSRDCESQIGQLDAGQICVSPVRLAPRRTIAGSAIVRKDHGCHQLVGIVGTKLNCHGPADCLIVDQIISQVDWINSEQEPACERNQDYVIG